MWEHQGLGGPAEPRVQHLPLCQPASSLLCRFLDEVQAHSNVNKMSVQNLATVFGPNILRPQIEDPVTIMEGTGAGDQGTMWLGSWASSWYEQGSDVHRNVKCSIGERSAPLNTHRYLFTLLNPQLKSCHRLLNNRVLQTLGNFCSLLSYNIKRMQIAVGMTGLHKVLYTQSAPYFNLCK